MSTPPLCSAQEATARAQETTAAAGPTIMPQWDQVTLRAEAATCTGRTPMWQTPTAPCSTALPWWNHPTASLDQPCRLKAACNAHLPSTRFRRTQGRSRWACTCVCGSEKMCRQEGLWMLREMTEDDGNTLWIWKALPTPPPPHTHKQIIIINILIIFLFLSMYPTLTWSNPANSLILNLNPFLTSTLNPRLKQS